MSKAASRAPRTDGYLTRSKIVEAAGILFSSGGFAETTSKTVAAHAGVDLASINYHFGSRNGLYQAVLVEAHRRLLDVADLQKFAQSDLPGADKLRVLFDYLVERAAGQGQAWHVQVLAREVVAPSSHIHALFQSELQPKLLAVKSILSDITGLPVEDPVLTRCMLTTVAPCLMLLIGSRGLPGPLREVIDTPREIVVDHLHRFALAGLQAFALRPVTRANRRRP